jgi:hypothetical protein
LRGSGAGTSKGFLKRKQGSSQSHEEKFESMSLDLKGHVAGIHVFHRKNPSDKIQEDNTQRPKSRINLGHPLR